MGFLGMLQRPELAGDPELARIVKLTRLASGLQDVWMHLLRVKPQVLDGPLSTRPDDPRPVSKVIVASMDEMGETCEAYLDGTMDAASFRKRVSEHVRQARALAAEIQETEGIRQPG